jgi:hypothetical protein
LSEYLKPLGVRKLPKWDEEEFWLWDRLAEAINAEISRNKPEPMTGDLLFEKYENVCKHCKNIFDELADKINAHFLGKGGRDAICNYSR